MNDLREASWSLGVVGWRGITLADVTRVPTFLWIVGLVVIASAIYVAAKIRTRRRGDRTAAMN